MAIPRVLPGMPALLLLLLASFAAPVAEAGVLGTCAATDAAKQAQETDCATFFWAFRKKWNDGRETSSLFTNIRRTLEIARATSPGLQLILGYSNLDGDKKSNFLDQIELLKGQIAQPFEAFDIGTGSTWASKLFPHSDAKIRKKMAWVINYYPHPLKSAVWHWAAQRCTRLLALDLDVIAFHDLRELLQPLRPGRQLIAPPESYTPEWCEDYHRLTQETLPACIARGKAGDASIDPKKVQKAICDVCGCPDYKEGASVHHPYLQASVFAMGPDVLRLWANESFVLNYLNITMRTIEGGRPGVGEGNMVDKTAGNFEEKFWKVFPRKGIIEEIPWPSFDGATVRARPYVSEQVGYMIALGCAGIRLDVFDKRSVNAGMTVNDFMLSNVGGICTGPVALHTFKAGLQLSLDWYPSWYNLCAKKGMPRLSWGHWSSLDR